jgi:hypothetical protein
VFVWASKPIAVHNLSVNLFMPTEKRIVSNCANAGKTFGEDSRRIFGWIFFCCCFVLLSTRIPIARADASTFDLIGPQLELKITRSNKTLPISNVSDLQAGDRLWIHPEFPADQSVHYLLIVAFLQGPTNPPPEDWFTRVETWRSQIRQEGTIVTVPKGAQQALLFLAPETGGDFTTLRSTVRGSPGVFVRASLDLDQASLDRTRLEKYLDEIRKTSNSDPGVLKKRSTLLAQTLRIKVDENCFNKPLQEQSSCLTQDEDQLVIDDAHSESLVTSLTSGPSSDLIGALGSSPVARGGYYSPYVGAVVDLARLMNNLHTANYQYIPALSLPDGDELNLRLNSPPSFHNPKSVLVVGLPAIEDAPLPPLRAVDPERVFCLRQSPLILPVEGAPLAFSTGMAHDFVLRLDRKSGTAVSLPATADAASGGFVVDTRGLHSEGPSPELTGTLHGFWGFKAFDGPKFQLRSSHSTHWVVLASDADALVAGRQAVLHLQSGCAACVEKVTALDEKGKVLKATWKVSQSNQLEIYLPLQDEHVGRLKLMVKQFGLAVPDVVTLQVYSTTPHLEHFALSAGDSDGLLSGTHLDEVASLELNGVLFTPKKQPQSAQANTLGLEAQNTASAARFHAEDNLVARVTLKDGRVLDLPTAIKPPRPSITLVSSSVVEPSGSSPVRLGNSHELPQDGRLSFFLKSEEPATFLRTERIEVATADGSFDTLLSEADGSLVLQDASSVLALFDPLKSFGPSAFGPLRFRPVDGDGGQGDWHPLAVLVRIPGLKEIRCPDSPDQKCKLIGTNLFLLASVAADPRFKNAVQVPAGYVSGTLTVPRPNGTLLYIRLRDDPASVDMVALPVLPDDDDR